jgi:hypothetical protein
MANRQSMVDARIGGRGERRFFATKALEEWAQRQRVKRQNEGDGAFDEQELSVFGWSSKDAISFALNHLRRSRASVPIETAVSQLLEAKQGAGRSERYLQDVRIHLGRLVSAFQGKKVAE